MRRAVAGLVVVSGLAFALAACTGNDSGATAQTLTTSTTRAAVATMRLTSSDFEDSGLIPTKFTCAGEGARPELFWTAPPKATQQLALLVFDPDAGAGFVHYLAWGIAPQLRNAFPDATLGRTPGMNGRGSEGWAPPCPPAGGQHHYEFTLYALDREPEIAPTANVHQFLDGIKGSVIAEGHLTGLFGR